MPLLVHRQLSVLVLLSEVQLYVVGFGLRLWLCLERVWGHLNILEKFAVADDSLRDEDSVRSPGCVGGFNLPAVVHI